MLAVFTLLAFVAHGIALAPMARRLARGCTPTGVDFACASVALYYDLGLVLELTGLHDDRFFQPFFSRPLPTVGFALLFLLVAPLLFRVGESIVHVGRERHDEDQVSRLLPERASLFYLLALAAALATALYGLRALLSNPALWLARAEVGSSLGPLIIILYVPLFAIGFFVRQQQARTLAGVAFLVVMVPLAVVATLSIGQRTLLILPLLIPLAFRTRLNYRRMASLLVGGILLASLVLPIFKWQFAGKERGPGELILDTIRSDFSRSGVLTTALELSEPAGTRILRYPFEGYVYAALFFVPRPLVPWKGQSTPIYYTAEVTRVAVEETNWVFGIGVIESAALNGGLLAVIPVLLLTGMALGALDRGSYRVPGIAVPVRLMGLWICSYDISALILVFGGMVLFGYVAHVLFVEPGAAKLRIRPPRSLGTAVLTPAGSA